MPFPLYYIEKVLLISVQLRTHFSVQVVTLYSSGDHAIPSLHAVLGLYLGGGGVGFGSKGKATGVASEEGS